jgi:hypothetical protein
MIKKWLLKKRLDKLNLEWIEITNYALLDYRYQVKGNQYESTWTLERKLNRNWQIATVVYDSEKIIHKSFGMLRIIFDKEQNKIVGITNHRGNYKDNTPIDKELKVKMYKIYGLA